MLQNEELIDCLARMLCCDNVSDLRFLNYNDKKILADIIMDIDVDDYPLWQWNDVLEYLTNCNLRDVKQQTKNEILKKIYEQLS